jgi:hypothetical protein
MNVSAHIASDRYGWILAKPYWGEDWYLKSRESGNMAVAGQAWRLIMHSGNIGTQTVAAAGSCTGNAATASADSAGTFQSAAIGAVGTAGVQIATIASTTRRIVGSMYNYSTNGTVQIGVAFLGGGIVSYNGANGANWTTHASIGNPTQVAATFYNCVFTVTQVDSSGLVWMVESSFITTTGLAAGNAAGIVICSNKPTSLSLQVMTGANVFDSGTYYTYATNF